ncbi:MAG TPA: glycosyltransferase [Solirubrobacterales bacterium]|nr:glycosyltransferase [Solirubrobacterales bacterium]
MTERTTAVRGEEGMKPVKVAFFPMHPVDDRASGTFCALPAARSADRGVVGTVFQPSSPKLYEFFYRRKTKGWQLRAAIYWYLIVLPRRLFQILRARRYDVIFVQRSMFRWLSPPVTEWIAGKVTGLPIAYHLDDGIWLEARPRWSELRCRLAATVITGNDVVAEFAERAGAKVTRIEYAVDVDAYPVKRHDNEHTVAIGYAGIYPDLHLAPIAEPLREVCEATGARVLVIGGLRRPQLGALDPYLDWQAWDPGDEHSWIAAFDIGIMPLADTELHRTKEPFKIKEYMAAGLPMVLSPVGHNAKVITDGREGFFATDPDQWRDRLQALVEDPHLRAEIGAKGRELALSRYDLPRLLDELSAVFLELAGRDLQDAATSLGNARARI